MMTDNAAGFRSVFGRSAGLKNVTYASYRPFGTTYYSNATGPTARIGFQGATANHGPPQSTLDYRYPGYRNFDGGHTRRMLNHQFTESFRRR